MFLSRKYVKISFILTGICAITRRVVYCHMWPSEVLILLLCSHKHRVTFLTFALRVCLCETGSLKGFPDFQKTHQLFVTRLLSPHTYKPIQLSKVKYWCQNLCNFSLEFTFQGTFQGPMMHITRELAYCSFQLSKLIIIGSNSVQKTPCNAPSPLDELNTFWLPLSGVAVSLGYQEMKHTECNKIYWTHLCFLEDVDQIYFPSVISLYYCIIMDPCSSFKPQPAGKV